MAYNDKAIIKDVEDKPVPQYYNKTLDEFEVLEGNSGATKSSLYDEYGNAINISTPLFDMSNKLNELTGTALDETIRQQNEIERQIRFENMVASEQQSMEVVDARQGETNLATNLTKIKNWIGNIGNLTTRIKTNLVNAINGVDNDLVAHKADEMPHLFINKKTNKTYRYGYQINVDGNPQIICEEVI